MKARIGVRLTETPREFAFCAYTIMQRKLLIIPDAARDNRFAAKPLVASGPKYRFYAGAPLVAPRHPALSPKTGPHGILKQALRPQRTRRERKRF